MIRRSLVTVGLAATMVVAGGGVASAHECYVANRSDKGNAGASHSANWYTLEVTELFASAHYFVPGVDEPLTPEQVATAVAMTSEAGIPTSFTLFERFTIPRSYDELAGLQSKSADGKGIDHFFAAYGEQLMAIAVAAYQS